MPLTIRAPQASSRPLSEITPFSSIAKSALATSVLIGLCVGFAFVVSASSFWVWHQPSDSLTNSQQQERASSFAALVALPLTLVTTTEVPSAIEGMHLSPSAKQSLLFDLAQLPQSASGPDAGETTQTKAMYNQSEINSPSPHKVSPSKISSLRLAWITLWDTDAEDGDAVRIDSHGYSRTVVLTKQPITFAIPVPITGNVNITGIRDGEGGGITVGLASGTSKVVFPIMSVGQVLGLKVKVN